jgi:hypothetical protein
VNSNCEYSFEIHQELKHQEVKRSQGDMVSRKKVAAVLALIFLLAASLGIAIFEYSQTSSLQNRIKEQDNAINDLEKSLCLAQLKLTSIYITPNGSVTGTNNIQRSGDLYLLTDNISGSIIVQKSNIIIDGAGYTLQGYGGTGIDLTSYAGEPPSSGELYNVTVKNLRIMDFNTSILARGGGNHTFYCDYVGRTVNEVRGGVYLYWSRAGSNITYCTISGVPDAIGMELSSGNTITENNLSGDVWVQMGGDEVVDRNYWSDYLTKYPNASEIELPGASPGVPSFMG